MKTIVLIHTTKSTLEIYPAQIEKALDFPIQIYNMYDDFFASVDDSIPQMEKDNLRVRRLRCFLEAAEIMKPDVVVVACSTISLEAERLRNSYCMPVLSMDDAVLEAVSDDNGKVVVFATSPNPVPAVTQRLAAYATRKGRDIEIEVCLCEGALPYLLKNDRINYTREVLECIKNMPNGDRILLAQGSTAILQKEIEEECRCQVFSSPEYLIEQLRMLLR